MKSYLIIFCIVVPAVSPTDYCSMSCGNKKHIGCNPNQGFDARSCPADARMENMDRSWQQVLIDMHNEKRNFIAGGGDRNHRPACRMGTMAWDDELAYLASLNVQQCKIQHDFCHNTDAYKFSGQSYARIYLPNGDPVEKLKRSVDGWYNEVVYSTQALIDRYPPNISGPEKRHFLVMMADRNIRLGCAASIYTERGDEFFLLFCNYASTNMQELPIYDKCNRAGERCETGPNPRYPNLCSENEHYEINDFSRYFN